MDDDSNKTHDNGKSYCWESGIKFVEKKRKKRICRGVLAVVMVVCSAFVGGIIGGGCVKSRLSYPAASGGQRDAAANTSAELIRQATEAAGPAVVGILTSSPDEGCSGIISDSSGYIITSYEVIKDKTSIMVVLPDKPEEPIEAKLIGADLKTNIAVLKIDIRNLTAALFKNEVPPRVGDMVLSIENPTGEEYSGALNVGYVGSVNKEMNIDDKSYDIIEASSIDVMESMGGALCSMDGSVMGICFVNDDEPKGYALCIDEVRKIAESIVEGSNAKEPYLGIQYKYLDVEIAKAYGKAQGVWISKVRSNSGAERAGLLKGDIVIMVNDEAINDNSTLARTISSTSPGDSISLRVWRDGNLIDITAIIGSSSI